jgi:hypothetical protein
LYSHVISLRIDINKKNKDVSEWKNL